MMQSQGQASRNRLGVGVIRRREDMDETAVGFMKPFGDGLELGSLDSCECWGMGQTVSVVVAKYRKAGLVIVVTHTKRYPTFDELAEARHRFAPASTDMAIPFPSDAKCVPFHKFTIVMCEVEARNPRIITEARHVHLL